MWQPLQVNKHEEAKAVTEQYEEDHLFVLQQATPQAILGLLTVPVQIT